MQFLLAILALVSTAHADQPGFLKDFNYQVTQLKTMGQAQALENSLTTETRNSSICANRAHYWSYELSKFKNIQTGKVFIHFTALGEANENKEWAYHVAPYVVVNGEEMVLDPVFAEFKKRPVKMENWTNHFGKSKNCVVLDPLNNPEHLKLEKNNVGADFITPLDEKTGSARQYPSTLGICYIRKVPMYFQWPSEVYGSDLYRTGDSQYSQFNYESFNEEGVLAACKQAVKWSVQASQSCSDYLGIKAKPGFLQKLLQDDVP
jgi:hypothetical protein